MLDHELLAMVCADHEAVRSRLALLPHAMGTDSLDRTLEGALKKTDISADLRLLQKFLKSAGYDFRKGERAATGGTGSASTDRGLEPVGAGPAVPRLGYYGCPEDQCGRMWTTGPGHRDVPTCHIKGDPLGYRSV